MTGLSARRLASACAVSVVSAVAFIAPGAANAANPCTGENIEGSGSSLQAQAQKTIWKPAFNALCPAEPLAEQLTEYNSTSSGKGLESWGDEGTAAKEFRGFGANNAFVGTDQPPNEKQKSAIESVQTVAEGKVLSIPVLQAAVALPIHLPTGCVAKTGKGATAQNRLFVTNVTLEKIFRHTITKWSEIKDNGDVLSGEGCNPETEIKRVVRKEGSGTTAIVKKYLFEINKEKVDGEKTWNNLAEENKNLEWPEEGTVIRAEKGSGVAKAVAATPSSIGYANLNEVRTAEGTEAEGDAGQGFTPGRKGGAGTAFFWPEVQNNGIGKTAKYADPATNGDAEAKANANCSAEVYVNGAGAKFPPASTELLWFEVTASTKEAGTKYALCGFTYDLSLTHFKQFPKGPTPDPSPTALEVQTVKNYLSFVLSSTEQAALEGQDFLGLPTSAKAKSNVLKIAQEGTAKIAF